MKIASSILFTLVILANFAQAQNKLQTAVNTFSAHPEMKHASISIQIIDLSNNNSVASLNPELTLPTASTAKLFSTATAIDILGPEYRPKTRVYIEGEIDTNGVLNGNLWIRGGGDPSIGSKYYHKEGHQLDFMQDWITELKTLGITSINGGVIADGSEFGYEGAPGGWNWVDLGNYYGAGPSGLTIYDNLVRYHFSTASTPGAPVKVQSIEPYVPGLTFHNYIKSSKKRGDNAYLFGGPYSLDRFGNGTLPINSSNFLVKGSLPDPELQFAYELTEALKSANISIQEAPKSARILDIQSSPETYQSRKLVITHEGQLLSSLIQKTNYRSINLFAEHMINLVGYEKTGDGSTASGLKVLENHWKNKFNTDGLQVNDGSGLSRTNAISADHFTALLAQMNQSSHAESFMASLPVAGETGTMRNLCKGKTGHGRIAAKSGSMTRIKSYAGYVNTVSGKKLAFAIIVNNATGSSYQLRSRMEVLMNQMAGY